MIRQELSEYTYGSGDIVKDVKAYLSTSMGGKIRKSKKCCVCRDEQRKEFQTGYGVGKITRPKEKMNENKVYKVGDTISLLSFDEDIEVKK